MTPTDWHELTETYEHQKPEWPRWWYAVGFLICIAALILILCSGPSRVRGAEPEPKEPDAVTCEALREAVVGLFSASMQMGFTRMQLALSERGVQIVDVQAVVDIANRPELIQRGWAMWGPTITARGDAILLVFGCPTQASR